MVLLKRNKIPNEAFEGINVFLKVRRYRCFNCNTNFSDINHMYPVNQNVSYSMILEIMNLSITGVPLTSVIRTFDNHSHIPRKSLSPILCIDEVYTKNSDFKSKYSCIFYDFLNRSLIDVLIIFITI